MSGILSFPKGVSEMVPRQIGRHRGDSRENGVSAMSRTSTPYSVRNSLARDVTSFILAGA